MMGIDWHAVYRPAALLFLRGGDPYTIGGFVNPPYVLALLAPFALLPERIGYVLLVAAAMCAFAFVALRLGASPVAALCILLSPPVLSNVVNVNLDWLVALALVLPPELGLCLAAIKPQAGLGIIVYWLFAAWRKGGVARVAQVLFLPSVFWLLSFQVYGPWFLRWGGLAAAPWNRSLWPWSLPAGVVLLVQAIRKRDVRYAVAASPCLSPYTMLHSWVMPLPAFASDTRAVVVMTAAMWVACLLAVM
jgi:hypothetical protein